MLALSNLLLIPSEDNGTAGPNRSSQRPTVLPCIVGGLAARGPFGAARVPQDWLLVGQGHGAEALSFSVFPLSFLIFVFTSHYFSFFPLLSSFFFSPFDVFSSPFLLLSFLSFILTASSLSASASPPPSRPFL